MKDGILNIYKPSGMTSNDVIQAEKNPGNQEAGTHRHP